MHARSAVARVLALTVALGALAGCGLNTPSRTGLAADYDQLRAQAASTGRVQVVVEYGTPANLTKLAEAGFDLWGVAAGKAKGTAAPATIQAMQAMKLKVTSFRKAENTFDKGYKTVDQVEADLKALAAKYPQLATLSDFGDSWEKTQGQKGHDLFVLKLGKGDTSAKPAVLYMGNTHAREIVTPEIVLNLAHLLLENYGTDPAITSYVDSRAIYLAPITNPDGHVKAEAGADQRKNTNNVTGGKRRLGVDLNRNYGFKWNTGGSSSDPESDTFMGKGAFSEPETQAVRELVSSRPFTFLMSYHQFSDLVLWPWGCSDAPPPDKRLPAIGMKLGALTGYKPQQSKDLYKTSGDTTDWAFGEKNILSYTIEIGSWGDGFDPPYSSMPEFWRENKDAALYLLKLADHPGAVFGPELTKVTVTGGQVQVQAASPVTKVEVYTGTPGTGRQFSTSGKSVSLSLPMEATTVRQALMVRAQGADGQWGPATAVWSK